MAATRIAWFVFIRLFNLAVIYRSFHMTPPEPRPLFPIVWTARTLTADEGNINSSHLKQL